MTIDETIGVLAVLKQAYPAFYKDMSKKDAEGLINLWTMMFESDPAKVVTEAVKSLIVSLKFPPTIADVKEKIALITQPKQHTELEAWGMVLKAIQNSSYYAKECFNNLPQNIQQLVGSPNQLREWGQMEPEVVNSVIQSNFMRSYKSKVSQDKEYSMLPESTKEMIQGLSQKFLINES